jgi:hypothetical protein
MLMMAMLLMTTATAFLATPLFFSTASAVVATAIMAMLLMTTHSALSFLK